MIGKFINPIVSGGTPEAPSWQRPADWLPLPTVISTDQTFVGLHAVIENGDNYAAFTFTTSAGQFRVDWGDGVIDLVNSGVNAEHQYNFATYDTGNTTLTTRGYKQAIIIVTPVSGNLLTVNFQLRFTTTLAQNPYSTGFLDCVVSMPNHTTAQFIFGGTTVNHSYLERFEVKTLGLCRSLFDMFTNCYSLQSVPLFNTGSITSIRTMFNNCHSLQSVPLFNTSLVTNMNNTFDGCYTLQSVPLFNTSNVNTMASMFANCYSLQSVPLFDTPNVAVMSSMFTNCYSLQSVPLFNTSFVSGSGMNSMFSGCVNLKSVPLFDTSKATTLSFMFNSCWSLKSVPLFNTSLVTSMGNMFSNCYSLQSVPLFDTSLVTTMSAMFSTCTALHYLPFFNTGKVTNMSNMFASCKNLKSVPLFNTGLVTNMDGMFNSCASINFIPELSTVSVVSTSFNTFASQASSLNRCTMSFGTTVSFNSCQLSKTEIEEILTNLKPRLTASATVTFTNNWGIGTVFSKTGTLTDNSTLITLADTSSLLVGMQVTGTGSPLTSTVAVTLQDAGDTVTLISHGLQDGDEISFATRVTTTGFALNTIYYVINSTLDTFQISATLGGTALPLTSNGSGTLRHRTEILSIVLNTSVTMSRPMRGSGAQTLAFRELRTGTGLLKNWVVTA